MKLPSLLALSFRESEVQPKDGEQGRKVFIPPCAFTWHRVFIVKCVGTAKVLILVSSYFFIMTVDAPEEEDIFLKVVSDFRDIIPELLD